MSNLLTLAVIPSHQDRCYFYPDANYIGPGGANRCREFAEKILGEIVKVNLSNTKVGLSDWGNNGEQEVMLRIVRGLYRGSETIVDIQFRRQGTDLFVRVRHYNYLISELLWRWTMRQVMVGLIPFVIAFLWVMTSFASGKPVSPREFLSCSLKILSERKWWESLLFYGIWGGIPWVVISLIIHEMRGQRVLYNDEATFASELSACVQERLHRAAIPPSLPGGLKPV